jgi:RNA polymerase primary sigma factor
MSAVQPTTVVKPRGPFFDEDVEEQGWPVAEGSESSDASLSSLAPVDEQPAAEAAETPAAAETPEAAEASSSEEAEERAEEESGGEERQGFLGMYFRDMSKLAVLRPSEEFERARHIEGLELDLWKTLLGFVAGAEWMSATVEKAVGAPVPEFKRYRTLAAACRSRPAVSGRKTIEKYVASLSARLRELDMDREYMEAAVNEVRLLERAARTGTRHGLSHGLLPAFVKTKTFAAYVRAVAKLSFKVKAAKNDFVKANLRLVVAIARRFNHGRMPLPDLIQEGNLGLIKAVDRYDYRRGFRFSTYASWWIRHAINRALADKGREVRLPVHMLDAYQKIAKAERELQAKNNRPATVDEIASATGIELEKLEEMNTHLRDAPVSLDRRISGEDERTLGDVLVPPDDAPAVSERLVDDETRRAMLELLEDLKPIEADVLRKRFGLVDDEERTLKEIGAQYHLSRERVRQIEVEALGKMRRAMARRDLR